ncbi:MAG: SH3 domain-containing protein [Candidatus Binatia bacterium]
MRNLIRPAGAIGAKETVLTMSQPKIQTRLCPHCANSIGVDALTCPYCKANLAGPFEPEWPRRDAQEEDHPVLKPEREKLTVKSKAILVLGLLVFAFGIYLVGGNVERHDLGPALAEQQNAVAEKDEKIKSLESQLVEVRRNNQGSTQQIDEFKAKLDQSKKDLATAQRKLTAANQEIARLSSTRIASAPRAPARTADAPVNPSPASRPTSRAEPRTYETVRSTPVHEEPANSSRVVAQITKGTQITVVGSGSGWLEIRSKHGKPPGFIRADDAMFVSRAN